MPLPRPIPPFSEVHAHDEQQSDSDAEGDLLAVAGLTDGSGVLYPLKFV